MKGQLVRPLAQKVWKGQEREPFQGNQSSSVLGCAVGCHNPLAYLLGCHKGNPLAGPRYLCPLVSDIAVWLKIPLETCLSEEFKLIPWELTPSFAFRRARVYSHKFWDEARHVLMGEPFLVEQAQAPCHYRPTWIHYHRVP